MAATLDGDDVTDMRIECGTPDVPSSTGGLTVMGWARPTGTLNTKRLMSKADGTNPDNHIWMISNNSSGAVWRSRLNAGGDTTTVSAGSQTLDAWQHIAARYDGSEDANFLNTVDAGSGANSGDVGVDASMEYWIGSQPPNDGTDEVFEGDIEDVRVYARSISLAELDCIFASNGHDGIVHGMILRHPLNDNSSGTIGAGEAKGLGSLQVDGDGVNGPSWSVGANIMAPRRRYR